MPNGSSSLAESSCHIVYALWSLLRSRVVAAGASPFPRMMPNEIPDAVRDAPQVIGFDERDEPTKEGLLLKSMVDKLSTVERNI